MTDRFSLVFENGDREGERVPIPASGLIVGRRPGSSLQILEGSVSGRHAELHASGSGVDLKDLGSTNGTRVGSERVLEGRLTHGDLVLFGNVRMRLVDGQMETDASGLELELEVNLEEPDAPAPKAPKPSAAAIASPVDATMAIPGRPSSSGDVPDADAEPQRIDEDKLRRSKKSGSKLVPLLLLGLIGGGAYAVFHLRTKGTGASKVRPVEAIEGNLLAGDVSFEEEGGGFNAWPDAPVEFELAESARFGGESGLSAYLAEGEWAMTRSAPVRPAPGRQLTVSAAFDVPEASLGFLGVEFHAEGDAKSPRPTRALLPIESQGFERVEWTVPVPAGYASARLCVAARGDGEVSVDDVALVQETGGAPNATFEETQLWLLGREACVVEVGRVQLSGIRFAKEALFLGALAQEARTIDGGFALDPSAGAASTSSAEGKLTLRLFVEPELLDGGLATLGASGYAPRSLEFDEPLATSLLAGTGGDLVRLRFPSARRVTGRPEGDGFAVEVDWSEGGELQFQLGFQEERATALTLAQKARQAQRTEEYGSSLSLWQELLDEHPYERSLVTEAEAARGKWIQKGLEEVRAVREEVSRARFFRLVDIYRACANEARQTAERYAPSEVETEARRLLDEIQADLATLEQELDEVERGRLAGILEILQAQSAIGLASEVQTYLNDKFEGQR